MKKLSEYVFIALAALAVNGCAQGNHLPSSNSSTGSSSGITIYGDIDTSIVRTR